MGYFGGSSFLSFFAEIYKVVLGDLVKGSEFLCVMVGELGHVDFQVAQRTDCGFFTEKGKCQGYRIN